VVGCPGWAQRRLKPRPQMWSRSGGGTGLATPALSWPQALQAATHSDCDGGPIDGGSKAGRAQGGAGFAAHPAGNFRNCWRGPWPGRSPCSPAFQLTAFTGPVAALEGHRLRPKSLPHSSQPRSPGSLRIGDHASSGFAGGARGQGGWPSQPTGPMCGSGPKTRETADRLER